MSRAHYPAHKESAGSPIRLTAQTGSPQRGELVAQAGVDAPVLLDETELLRQPHAGDIRGRDGEVRVLSAVVVAPVQQVLERERAVSAAPEVLGYLDVRKTQPRGAIAGFAQGAAGNGDGLAIDGQAAKAERSLDVRAKALLTTQPTRSQRAVP